MKAKILIALITILASDSLAAKIRKHSDFSLLVREARQVLRQEGCVETNKKPVGEFISTRKNKDTFLLVGANHEVSCINWGAIDGTTPPETTDPIAEPTNNDIKITWQIPTERRNGDTLPLSELAGYEIYHVSENGKDEVINVIGGNTTAYLVENIAKGKHFFSISSKDTEGRLSDPSAIIMTEVMK